VRLRGMEIEFNLFSLCIKEKRMKKRKRVKQTYLVHSRVSVEGWVGCV
jgi:hypothetical protein